MTVGVPVPFEVEVEVSVEVPVEVPVEVEKIVVQTVERPITPTPTQIPMTEIDWWLPPLWKGFTGAETDESAGYGDWPLAMVEQFRELQPGIRVLPRVTSWSNHRLALDTALAGGPEPDLFYEAAGSFRIYGIQGTLQPIDPYVTLDGWRRFSDLPREQATMSGLALFHPFLLNATGLLVNRQLFREADAEDAIPAEGDRTWTFAEFQDAAARVGSTEAGRYAIAWPLGGFGRRLPSSILPLGPRRRAAQ